MLTVEIARTTDRGSYYIAKITLADGTAAGEGYAGTIENAIHFAGTDAIGNGHTDAGRHHIEHAEELARTWAASLSAPSPPPPPAAMTLTLMNGERREVATHAEASAAVRAEIDAAGVGGEEWSSHRAGRILVGGKVVAHVSYNGKVWAGPKWTPDAVPLFNPYAAGSS